MIAVLGSFRLPPEALDEAGPMMRAVIEATLREPGCRSYSYAMDVLEPGLIRVHEVWDSRAALEAHFASPHMALWSSQRSALGFADRSLAGYELGAPEPL